MSKKLLLRRRKKRRRKKNFRWKIFFLISSSIFFLFVVPYLLFLSPLFWVKKVEVFSNQKALSNKVSVFIRGHLEKKAVMLSSQSIFLLKKKAIEKLVLENFPEISSIKIKREIPNVLAAEIKERKPAAILLFSQSFFLLDENGIPFKKSAGKGGLPLLEITTLKGEPPLGKEIISPKVLSSILEFEKGLKSLGVEGGKFSLVSPERVNFKAKDGWKIYFNPLSDISWQLTKLRALFSQYLPPKERKKLDYIELRFGNLAPYKYK